MKAVIYLDELLLTNFVIAVFLLLGAGLVCGCACSGGRLAAGSALAAASTLILFAPALPFAVQLGYKAGSAAACVAAAYPWRGKRAFARLCCWYFLLNLLLAGLAAALIIRQSLPGGQTKNLTVYLDLSPGLLLACVTGVYALLRAVTACFGRPARRLGKATLVLLGCSIPVRFFYDTGFSVSDPLSGRAVVLLSYPAVREKLPAALTVYLDRALPGTKILPTDALRAAPVPDPSLRVRFIECGTVTGKGLLPAVPAEKLIYYRNDKILVREKLLAAFCGAETADAGWELLLGPELAAPLRLED